MQSDVRKPRRFLRRVTAILVIVLVIFVGAETIARSFGLADAPAYLAEPGDLEYRLTPSQVYHPLRRTFAVNQYSQRADEYPPKKSRPDEFRVLCLGDSVLMGGVRVDQVDLATEILRHQLEVDLKRPVTVGNASAKSWGPPNLLAYARQFGFLDADVVVILLSSHDAFDVPNGKPVVGLSADYPSSRPALSSLAVLKRLLARGASPTEVRPEPVGDSPEAKKASADLRELIRLARSSGAKVLLALHSERTESPGKERAGHEMLANIARGEGAGVVELGPIVHASLSRGESPYLDEIHTTSAGQRIIADSLTKPIESTDQKR